MKDFCLVCGIEFTRTHSKQVTCLNEDCKKGWKSGKKKPKVKKTYTCLRCNKITTRGHICKECNKANSKIQEWETW